jgi:hypothetical protein
MRKTIDLGNGAECRIYVNGTKLWYLNDKLHRTDGPAIECANGDKAWYYEGEYIICQSTQEFQRLIRLKGFW